MKKIDNIESICGGRIIKITTSDNNIELKDGNIVYKVINDKTNMCIAYFLSFSEAVNFDRFINQGFLTPKYIIGPNGLYEESDCYEIASMND